MKKLLTFVVIIFAIIMMNACKSSDTPEKVAEKFLRHIDKKEFTEAKKLVTPESVAFLDLFESFSKVSSEETKENKIENMKCVAEEGDNEEGERVVCNYTENGEDRKLDLVKKDGKWLVEFKIESELPDITFDETETDTAAAQDTTTKK